MIVDSDVRSSSLRFCACNDSRSASRRDSSASMETMSPMLCALASSARTRSTLACAVAIRASRSTAFAVTSSVDSSRLSSLPSLASVPMTDVNFADGTRKTMCACDFPSSLVRWSPPTNPPAPSAAVVAFSAASSTLDTRTVMVPV